MDSEPQGTIGKRRHSIGKKFAIAGLLFAAFMIYRIFGVYTVRFGECDLKRPVVPVTQRLQKKDERGRIVHYPARNAGVPDDKRLVIMTYNIEGHAALIRKKHLEGIAAVIKANHPDIVGLQEVHRGTWQSRFTDQSAELARLTGMNIAFGKSFSAMGGEFGNAVLTRGEIVASRVHELPSIGEPRTALEAEIRIDGAEVSFFVTHLTTWGKFRRASRTDQITCLTEAVQRTTRPYILVGDFNAGPDAPEVVTLLGSQHIRARGLTTDGTHKLTKQCLDYILADYGWGTLGSRVVREGPSDHYPLMAELVWHERQEDTVK